MNIHFHDPESGLNASVVVFHDEDGFCHAHVKADNMIEGITTGGYDHWMHCLGGSVQIINEAIETYWENAA